MMDAAHITTLLEQHDVKPTANRIVVARTLAGAAHPMTLAELENRILSIDKSGIFRSLTLFRDHHLVHVIEGGAEGVKYELCRSHDHEHDDDQHAHFCCDACHQTFCLDATPLPDIALPEGFTPRAVSVMVHGVCPDCAARRR